MTALAWMEGVPTWRRDPLVWVCAAATFAIHIYLFPGTRYLPYIDWSNHVGLVGVLAHGADTGADAFFERSYAPTPYWLFYVMSAALSYAGDVFWAAQMQLVITATLLALAGAAFAESVGRDPRQGLLAPLVMFGFALGYGFASFLSSLPWLLFSLAAHEAIVRRAKQGERVPRGTVAWFGICLLLSYLSHALSAAVLALALILRFFFVALFLGKARGSKLKCYLSACAIAASPAVAIGIAWAIQVVMHPVPEPGSGHSSALMQFHETLAVQLANWRGHLLDRGSSDHLYSMGVALGLGILLMAKHLLKGSTSESAPCLFPIAVYLPFFLALYLFGPTSLAWPVGVWIVYERFATLAAFMVFMLPRPTLRGRWGVMWAVAVQSLLLYNATINRRSLLAFDAEARPYDQVRAIIPPGARVLALTEPSPGDIVNRYPSLRTLHFYHLADGTAYGAYCFDNTVLPVHYRPESQRPPAPAAHRPLRFDPARHGAHYDYWVFRGPNLNERAHKHGQLILKADGWHVYRPRSGTVELH